VRLLLVLLMSQLCSADLTVASLYVCAAAVDYVCAAALDYACEQLLHLCRHACSKPGSRSRDDSCSDCKAVASVVHLASR
jgi:hypothetical protein